MRKIPTLFVRDPDNPRAVLPEVHPDCLWVLDGEGTATRKYDGTCVMLDEDGDWWARREVKPGKEAPADFVLLNHDPATGKLMGWEPIEQTGWAKFHTEALGNPYERRHVGTYELCGPKVNRNPEGCDGHVLVRHADAEIHTVLSGPEPMGPVAQAYDFARREVLALRELLGWEGIVWHHPDGRMAKLKARDFR